MKRGRDDAAPVQLPGGHINRTYLVERAVKGKSERCVLQWVNAIFATTVQQDIAAVTRWLRQRGVTTFVLLPTRDNALFLDDPFHGVWRLLSYIDGETRDFASGPGEARSAGRALGAFHAALADFDKPFAHKRGNVHELERHVERLAEVLDSHVTHPRFDAIAPLANTLLELGGREPPLPTLPERVVHGDPKISNVLFERGTERALCLIDLDTLSRMPLPLELGDAFRSWCNTRAEDDTEADFSASLFAAALDGYRCGAGDLLDASERALLVSTARRIAIELAVRFCRDALAEDYFGYDATRFATRGAHNEARARGQLALARSIEAQRPTLERLTG